MLNDEPRDNPTPSVPTPLDWQVTIADTLAARGVTVAAYVPDSRLNGLLSHLEERSISLRSLTREEECVGYAIGQRIAGRRPVVLMQSSGLGNSLNVIGTLAVPYRLGIPLIVSMRGTLGEANPSQIPMGRAAIPFLTALGIQAFSLRVDEDAKQTTDGVLTLAFEAGECAALILEPELGGGRESK
jgi:sulfopyruvate decarboxylase subunit alpha